MGILGSALAARSGPRAAERKGRTAGGGGGLAAIIEQRLETPVFFVVTVMMVIRAAQQFSGGALVMSRFLGPVWFPRFEIITGLGLGLGSEMLMTIAGRTWRSWKREATEIAARPGLAKIQRASYTAHANANARHSFTFMLIGMGASLYTGVAFLLTNAGATLGSALADVVTVAVISATVLYLGVFREARSQDAAQAAIERIESGMNDALDAAIARFRDGTYTDVDTRLIAESLPAHRQTAFRRSVAKQERGRVWKSAQLRAALGIGQDASRIRDLNRKIGTLAKTPEHGLDKDTDGRTWLIPHRVVMDVWGEEIALERVRRGEVRDTRRTGDGESVPQSSGLPALAPDIRRTRADRAPDALALASSPAMTVHTHGTPPLHAEPFR